MHAYKVSVHPRHMCMVGAFQVSVGITHARGIVSLKELAVVLLVCSE